MVIPPDADDFEVMTALLEYIVDSYEKLEVLVHVYRSRPVPVTAHSIARTLGLAPETVTEVLATLERAGVVRVGQQHDDAGWWFDPTGVWTGSVDVLVDLYDIDRTELLAFIKQVALQSFRSPDRRTSVLMLGKRQHRKPALPN